MPDSPRPSCCRKRNRSPRRKRTLSHQRRCHILCPRPSPGGMQKLLPRSPYDRLGGYVHLPRLIDKAKLHRKGLLDGYNYKTVGFDKHLLAFLKLNPDAFEEAAHRLDDDNAILQWISEHAVKHDGQAIEE